MFDLQPVQQQRPQGRQAGSRDVAVEAAEIALAAALDQQGRQPVGEGPTRQPAIAHPADQPVGWDGQAVFGERLAQQGMQQVSGAGAQAVAPEQLGVDELAQLPGLGRRQVFQVLKPGMAPPRRRPGARRSHPERTAQHSPGGMTGPARNVGDEGRRQTGGPLAAEAIGRHGGIRRLEEDRVTALPRDQPRGPAPAHAGGNLTVIGDVQPLQGGSHAFAQRPQLAQADALDGLADRLELETQTLGDG